MSKKTPHPFPRAAHEPVSHDKLTRTLMECFFEDLIEIILPDLAETIDWSTLSFEPRESFEKFTRSGGSIPDLVAKVEIDSGEKRLLVLNIEIEARHRSRRGMGLRLWDSLILLYQEHRCPIVSAVVYLSKGKPGVAKETVAEQVGPLTAWSFDYVSLGLSGLLAEEWLERPQALVGALAAWMGSRKYDAVEKKIRCLDKIVRSDVGERGKYLLANTVETYVKLDAEEEKRYRAHLSDKKEIREMVITWDDALAYSKERGLAEGEKRGLLIATRQAILLMARKRPAFVVPEDAEARLEAIDDLDRLHKILDNVLGAASFEDLLG